MEIYLVRHGETGGNVAHRHQAKDTPLSNLGKEQVRHAAEEIMQFEPTHLVTSKLVRAIESASIIGEVCDLIPETNEHFIELTRPDHMYGHYHRSMKSMWFYLQWYMGKDVSVTSGGESYEDLRQRFKLAQEHLALQYPKDARVVVVSHAVFINLFVAHLCRDQVLSPLQAASVFHKILTMPNTKITPVFFDEEDDAEACAWSVDS